MPRLLDWTHWLATVLGLAVCYFLAGQIGLLQAIQPGYATAIWPASGIALAGVLLFGNRVWPGVLLGSFAVNVPASWDAETSLTAWLSLALPFGIGCGAALQAAVGAIMVRRVLGFPNPLNREQDVAKLILFVLPVSCLIGATMGVGLLWSTGRVRLEECAFNWWTWYLGDAIGVFVVAPLTMLWTASQPDWPHRPLAVTLPVSVLALLVVVMFIYTKHREEELLRNSFERRAESLKRAMETTMDSSIEALNRMNRYHGKFPNRGDHARFARIAERTLRRRGDTIEGLAWLPRVRDDEREQFEKAGADFFKTDFWIKDRDKTNQFVKSAARAEYFPLTYRSPPPDPLNAWGFDIASQTERAEVLARAMKSSDPIASPPLEPLQNHAAEKRFLIYLAIYRDGVAPDSADERQNDLVGYMVAILRVDRLAKSAWESIDKVGIDITLSADSTDDAQGVVYYHLPAMSVTPEERHARVIHPISFASAGRIWTLTCVQTPQYENANRSLQSWGVLSLGTLVTGVFGGILLVFTGRTALFTKLVEERTAELEQTNATLVQQIRERLGVEEQLRNSREESRLIIDTAADAFIALDDKGMVTGWNRQAEISFGWSHVEAMGKPLAELILPDRSRHMIADILKTFGRGEDLASSKPFELNAKARDGREFPVEWTIWPTPTGPSLSFNSFARDITERKQSEERFRGLLESAPIPMVIVDEAGRIDLVNSQLEIAFGYARAELLGQMIEILVPQRSRANHPRFRETFFANPQVRPMGSGLELHGLRKDGSEFPVEISLSPLQTPHGMLVTAAIRDISERKHAEEVLRRSEAALLESRHLVDRIAEMMPSILYVYDLHQHCYVFVNNRIQSILGYDPQAVKRPQAALLVNNYHPDDLPTMEWVNEQYQTAEDDAIIETEYRMRHSNGEWRWLHTYNTIFVRDANGEPRQILGTAQDVTERKRLEQEVLDIAAQEQRRIGQELHDGTGQELTGLCMLADNLAETLLEVGRPEEQLARRIAQGLRHALGDVRGLSRGLVPVEVDAEGLMSSLNDLAASITKLGAVKCVFECSEPVPVEDNNTATQLYRIAQEAITNALRHGHASQIRVTLEVRGYYLTLRVTDDGIGLPPNETMSEGMGLRIMRYRAGQIGAQLSVRGGTTRGTVVVCTLFRGTFDD